MNSEFTFFGMKMPVLTIGYGLFLIAWAAIVSILVESKSITSWIPAMIGLPILVGGLLAKSQPAKRKLWMHVAVSFGLIAFLGGLDFFRGITADGGPFAKPAAGASKLLLLLTGGVYTFACVKSFIWARRSKSDSQ